MYDAYCYSIVQVISSLPSFHGIVVTDPAKAVDNTTTTLHAEKNIKARYKIEFVSYLLHTHPEERE